MSVKLTQNRHNRGTSDQQNMGSPCTTEPEINLGSGKVPSPDSSNNVSALLEKDKRPRTVGTPLSPNADAKEFRNLDRRDRMCWYMFVLCSFGVLASLVTVAQRYYAAPTGGVIRVHSFEYFLFCILGGVLSGIPHTFVTPLDLVKCRMQVGEYTGFKDGFQSIYGEGRGMTCLRKASFFFRGWAPTFIGYCIQGAFKFGLYEYFKFKYASMLSYEFVVEHKVWIFLAASASAEFFADIALSPWEAVKVKIQTTRQYPPVMSIVMPRMYAVEGFSAFFKGLTPLWCRQIPYTMVKFSTFEKTVEVMYVLLQATMGLTKAGLPGPVQLSISLLCGYIAGTFCAIVSHPADTVVSKLNQRGDGRVSAFGIIRELPCSEIWKGLPVRIAMIGTLTGLQWLIYDGFKVIVGLPTTGGGGK